MPMNSGEQGVASMVDALVKAWNVHDPRAFAACFAADADFTNVFGMAAKGRDAVEQFHAPIFETMFRDSRLSATDTRTRFLNDEIAAVDVRWEMTGARDPMGKEWPKRHGLMSLIAMQDGRRWSIAVMHNMDIADDMAAAQEKLQKSDG
ncbi:MAG: SgcJ/EcaC family oxidoreductase [Candidatus Eiseniibacteriota bacterium]